MKTYENGDFNVKDSDSPQKYAGVIGCWPNSNKIHYKKQSVDDNMQSEV